MRDNDDQQDKTAVRPAEPGRRTMLGTQPVPATEQVAF